MKVLPAEPLSRSYFPGSGIVARNFNLEAATSITLEPTPGWAAMITFITAEQTAGGGASFHQPYLKVTDEAAERTFYLVWPGNVTASCECLLTASPELHNTTTQQTDGSAFFYQTMRLPIVWFTGKFKIEILAFEDNGYASGNATVQLVYRRLQEP